MKDTGLDGNAAAPRSIAGMLKSAGLIGKGAFHPGVRVQHGGRIGNIVRVGDTSALVSFEDGTRLVPMNELSPTTGSYLGTRDERSKEEALIIGATVAANPLTRANMIACGLDALVKRAACPPVETFTKISPRARVMAAAARVETLMHDFEEQTLTRRKPTRMEDAGLPVHHIGPAAGFTKRARTFAVGQRVVDKSDRLLGKVEGVVIKIIGDGVAYEIGYDGGDSTAIVLGQHLVAQA